MEWLDENVLEETVVKRMSVVHMDTSNNTGSDKWRDNTLELLTRMTELLETMMRNSRGGSS